MNVKIWVPTFKEEKYEAIFSMKNEKEEIYYTKWIFGGHLLENVASN